MKQQIITDVVQQMLVHLDNTQLQQLQKVLEHTLFDYEITVSAETSSCEDNQKLMDSFVSAKRIEGCSEKTLKYYRTTIETMVGNKWMKRCDLLCETSAWAVDWKVCIVRIFMNYRRIVFVS